MAGFDIQTIGRQPAYILRSETKLKKFKLNKTSAGISITLLGENVVTGLKIEDQIAVGKRLALVVNVGTVRSSGDTAYGANLECQFSIGRNSKMAIRVGMNNEQSSQIFIKTNSSELQAALIGIVPIANVLYCTLDLHNVLYCTLDSYGHDVFFCFQDGIATYERERDKLVSRFGDHLKGKVRDSFFFVRWGLKVSQICSEIAQNFLFNFGNNEMI
ncbi:hypothetical protein NC652_022317 [Populus alba x Populus x berolinensis]|nr:hypothetical protein NC652_022317 [Populus alba x Populus x berolinensis]